MKNIDFVGYKKWYLGISGLMLIIGLAFIVFYGLKFSIEFTGGSQFIYSYHGDKIPNIGDIEKTIEGTGNPVISARVIKDEHQIVIRTDTLDQTDKNEVSSAVSAKYKNLREESFETVGPTIGEETKQNAVKAVVISSIAIMAYIAFAFREVSKPVASWKFGLAAIAALIHDVLVTVGIFAIFGALLNVEIDPLFITALLTIMGFSVHDTIVVFDRIRENLKKNTNYSFETVVNNSLMETLTRSLRTSLTVVLVLFALLLFGSPSILWFVIALLIGIVLGTYSSIFTASQLLVVWYEWSGRAKRRSSPASKA